MRLFPLMNEAGVADAGGAAATPSPAAAPSPVATPAAAPAPAAGSLLANAAPQPQLHERFAEKYRVNKEDGTFDLEATALKSEDARSQLEKRLGSGDAPPATPEEYKIEKVPEGYDLAEVMADPITQSLLKRMHGKGVTTAQAQEVLDFALSEWMPQLLDGRAELDASTCEQALRETWKAPEDFQKNTAAAHRAFQAYADPADRGKIDEIGNNPVVVRLLARIGAEIREDTSVNSGSGVGGEDIGALMNDEAYWNPKHANHARVSATVRQHFERKYPGTNA